MKDILNNNGLKSKKSSDTVTLTNNKALLDMEEKQMKFISKIKNKEKSIEPKIIKKEI